ncbi:MAG: ATPase, T2SS/T4P/T4SS family [Spirochaetales bacterium]|nr:ATPase, T2SS/T4P/T4SS family [Spirochaetales bacterium]
MNVFDNAAFGTLLVESGKLSQSKLDRATSHIESSEQQLPEILLSLGFLGEEDILVAKATLQGLTLFHIEDGDVFLPVDLSKDFHRQHLFCLVQRADRLLLVLDTLQNSETLSAAEICIQNGSPDRAPTIQLVLPHSLQELCDLHYDLMLSTEEESELFLEESDLDRLMDMASEAPVIKYVNSLVDTAVSRRASDIHIEPFEAGQVIRFRVDGILYEYETPLRSMQAAIVSRIKLLAALDIAERRIPQDGKISMRLSGKEIDLRVSTLPTIHGEGVVIRILEKENVILELSNLGMPQDVEDSFQSVIGQPNGIILVTGPTGSGKTTTLYCALNQINSGANKIITVEDPVEYQLHGINQIQVRAEVGLTFAKGLRAIVRQDTDVIMIGEIRDLETAEIAVQSSLTGHLVFSTLHTNDALSAIIRMIDIGVERFLIASALRGVLAQRLVRRICPHCKCDRGMASDYLDQLPGGQDFILQQGEGCAACGQTGYSGRVGLYELLTLSSPIASLISRGADLEELSKAAVQEGFSTMFNDGMTKAQQGITSMTEVLRITREAATHV